MHSRMRVLGSFAGAYTGFLGSRPFLALSTAAVFAGSTIAGKFASESLDPISIILVRSLMALMFLAILAAPQGTAAFKVSPRHLLPIALLGASGIVGYVYFVLLSLDHTALSNTAIISSLSPVITAVAAAILIGERLSARSYFGLLVSLGGVLLLLSQGNWDVIAGLRFNYGDRLMLLAVGCSVFYGLVAKILSGRYPAITLTLYMTLAAVVILLVIVDWQKLATVETLAYDVWLALFFMGVVSSGFGYMLYNVTVKVIGPTRTSCSVYSATPVFVMVLAYWIFSEAINLLSALSAVLISLGLYLTLYQSTKSASNI